MESHGESWCGNLAGVPWIAQCGNLDILMEYHEKSELWGIVTPAEYCWEYPWSWGASLFNIWDRRLMWIWAADTLKVSGLVKCWFRVSQITDAAWHKSKCLILVLSRLFCLRLVSSTCHPCLLDRWLARRLHARRLILVIFIWQFTKLCFLYREKCTSMHVFFSKFWASSFSHCVFYCLRPGRWRNDKNRALEIRFFVTSRGSGPEISVRMRGKTAGFFHVLSVSVVPFAFVESAMECQLRVNAVFFAQFLWAATLRSLTINFRKSRLWRQRKPLACGPKHCRFSRTSHGCLPTSCDTRGSKVSAILRDWQKQDAERAALWARSTKTSLSENPLFTVECQAGLHEVQRQCDVKNAHDARDHHSATVQRGMTAMVPAMSAAARGRSWFYQWLPRTKRTNDTHIERYAKNAKKTRFWTDICLTPGQVSHNSQVLREKPPEGYMWSWERLTKRQATSTPDHLWPEIWRGMSRNCKLKEKQNSAGEKTKLDNARILRGMYFIDREDPEFKETINNARTKLEVPKAPAMPCPKDK